MSRICGLRFTLIEFYLSSEYLRPPESSAAILNTSRSIMILWMTGRKTGERRITVEINHSKSLVTYAALPEISSLLPTTVATVMRDGLDIVKGASQRIDVTAPTTTSDPPSSDIGFDRAGIRPKPEAVRKPLRSHLAFK